MTTATPARTTIGSWVIDPAHSKAGFAVRHMGISTVRGEFREFEGTIEIAEDPASSRARGTAQAASVYTNNEQRDEHLRSPDFFNAGDNPELSFESKRIETVDEDTLRIVGDLTINGVTREQELTAEVLGTGLGAEDEERLGFEVTGQLSRKDYGIKFNAALGSGDAVVADKVKIELDIEAVKAG